MSLKEIFVKKYTRDYSLIIEEAWSASFLNQLENVMGWKNPNKFHNVFYLTNGVVEVWENENATGWVMDKVLEESKKGTKFINKIISEHKNNLKYISDKNKAEMSSVAEIAEFVYSAMVQFTIIYLSAIDIRTPENVKRLVIELREKDSFFVDADKIIRGNILKLFPKLKGLENGILSSEINKLPSIIELKERQKGFVVVPGYLSEKTDLIDFSKKQSEFKFAFDNILNKKISEVTGQIAFRGIARGKVRLLFSRSKSSKVLAGEIIVSPMTTPDMAPAMKRAAGIVTDEGGITSHAAIVARELKIPAIIGTKIATKILKNGDEVEVDANKGVVRIIKRISEK